MKLHVVRRYEICFVVLAVSHVKTLKAGILLGNATAPYSLSFASYWPSKAGEIINAIAHSLPAISDSLLSSNDSSLLAFGSPIRGLYIIIDKFDIFIYI